MEKQKKNVAWGMDYRKIRQASHKLGERWLLVITDLENGRLLNTGHSPARPQVPEVRRLLAQAVLKHPMPEALWCDAYLAKFAAPECDKLGVRLHIRTAKKDGLQWNYDERLDRAMSTPPTAVPALAPRAHDGLFRRARRYWLN